MIARIVVGLGLTYHDPCFLGRHNTVFIPPRQILEAVPGVTAEEMHRCKNRGSAAARAASTPR
jgi:Fe-S oxidoreductase